MLTTEDMKKYHTTAERILNHTIQTVLYDHMGYRRSGSLYPRGSDVSS